MYVIFKKYCQQFLVGDPSAGIQNKFGLSFSIKMLITVLMMSWLNYLTDQAYVTKGLLCIRFQQTHCNKL